ncbi:MAG: LysR family transcriptional regulator [Candidatus Thiodiazotropha lotti]|uniref:HTH lysR-type domain-containing protein n=1 Tax=Candidatus Thiodiazotropha endoloripes TaxID=1818881 RepID=A0A1E2UUA6_9GAMM|nr:LysR family transcriptional regulator [Candidatus Thiodiazotropha endoloripes]MCG7900479.1 LysR family transcriptional regulator [Candidatus Thiodiazotropha weberae]MCG7993254.1 LysR family transcriptional regulator [Candidatus Thiodiazotropha lotti]MCG7904012.1 LysR family transcriptional regulator [Candidatus Thiodiazotropha weberae]MCG7915344.1 LysR family transcriptional regulator [Candidatus Thiodiazotropha weberae]MCG8001401.1 LysR family transcriptional regulator [Candidatus Thiodiaz
MDLLLMRSLVAIADTGSITEAADRIGLTQPALSRRLQQLEDYFGAELFSRGRKGVQLTEIGRLVENEARILIARYDHLRDQVRAHQGLEGGTVRIGGGATAVSFLLPKAIASFQGSHPAVKFQLKEAGSNEVAEDVINGRLELGLVTMPVKNRELKVWPLLTDRIVLVGPKQHPLAKKRRISASALDGISFVGFEADTAVRQIIDATLRDAGVAMNVVMELRSIPAILRMVATTGNLAFVSQLGVDSLEDVAEIEVKDFKVERELAVIARRGSTLSPAAQAFADLLRNVVVDG